MGNEDLCEVETDFSVPDGSGVRAKVHYTKARV